MTTPVANTPLTPFSTDYDLADVLRVWKKDVMISLNCHAIGIINSFNAMKQLGSATIAYQKVYYRINNTNNQYESYLLPYPLLVDAPVVCLGGGNTALTFPIAVGDECLILFNDRDIDNWFSSNPGGAPATGRNHSFTDAFILVGLRSLAHVLSNYSTTHAVIRNNAGAKVGVNATTAKVLIGNNGSTLGSALQAFCTTCEGSGDATLVSAASALSTALGSLLE